MAEAKDNVTKWDRLREYVEKQRSVLRTIEPTDLVDRIALGPADFELVKVQREMDRLDVEAKAEGKAW